MLRDKTVKELRDLAKAYPDYTTKIKLKSDLIQFLAGQHYADNYTNRKIIEGTKSENVPITKSKPKAVKRRPKHLPLAPAVDSELEDDEFTTIKLDSNEITNGDNNSAYPATSVEVGKPSKVHRSKKDILFEFVVQRYPPLAPPEDEDAPEIKLDGVDLDDVRAQYHPIMNNLRKTTSDMELVFVGTASCCPSSTRGVSCTALRLNWRRNTGHGKLKHLNYLMQKQHDKSTSTDHDPDMQTFVNGGKISNNVDQPDNNKVTSPVGDGTFEAGTWIFDSGECTQLQLQRTSYMRPGKITKIFITHAHGDHTFGLPGVLCLMGQDRSRDGRPVEIYGPEGLRVFLRIAIRYSASRIVPNYVVHELKNIPMAPTWRHAAGWYTHSRGKYVLGSQQFFENERKDEKYWGPRGLVGEDPSAWITASQSIELEMDSNFGEVGVGRDIYPRFDHPDCVDGAPIWEVEDEGDVMVHAAPMSHGVPCVGYVVTEQNKPGRLRPDIIQPIIERNSDELRKIVKNPMKMMAVIKNMPEGSSYTFPDGTVVKQSDVVELPRKGRKVVILGDTLDAGAISGLAKDADVVVHEATNTYLSGIDKGTTLHEVTVDTMRHGHSTPYMAGEFAKNINAKKTYLKSFQFSIQGRPDPG